MCAHQSGDRVIDHGVQFMKICVGEKKRTVALIFEKRQDVGYNVTQLLGCKKSLTDILVTAAVQKLLHVRVILENLDFGILDLLADFKIIRGRRGDRTSQFELHEANTVVIDKGIQTDLTAEIVKQKTLADTGL